MLKIYFFFISISIFGYSIVSTFPFFFDNESRLFTIPFRGIVLVLSIFIISINLKFLVGRFNKLVIPWIGFFLIYYFILIKDYYTNPSFLRLPPFEYFASITICFMSPPAFAISCLRVNNGIKILKVVFLFGVVSLFLNLIIFTQQDAFNSIGNVFSYRHETRFFNPISLSIFGYYISMMAVLMIVQSANTIFKPLVILLSFLGFFLGLLGGSRGPLFTFTISIVIILMVFKKYLWIYFLSIFALLILSLYSDLELAVFSRIYVPDPSDNIRFELFSDALNLIFGDFTNLFFGVGIEPLGFYPHNIFIESVLAGGIILLLLLLFIILFCIYESFFIFKNRPDYLWLNLIFYNSLLISLVNGCLYQDFLLWNAIFAIVLISIHLRRKKS